MDIFLWEVYLFSPTPFFCCSWPQTHFSPPASAPLRVITDVHHHTSHLFSLFLYKLCSQPSLSSPPRVPSVSQQSLRCRAFTHSVTDCCWVWKRGPHTRVCLRSLRSSRWHPLLLLMPSDSLTSLFFQMNFRIKQKLPGILIGIVLKIRDYLGRIVVLQFWFLPPKIMVGLSTSSVSFSRPFQSNGPHAGPRHLVNPGTQNLCSSFQLWTFYAFMGKFYF